MGAAVEEEESLSQTRNELAHILRLKGEHRSTENVLEHFVQFILSVAVLVANDLHGPSDTKIVELSTSDIHFSTVSSVVSMLSMVRGQINLIKSQKNGQLGLLATFLIAFYMTVAIFTHAGIIFASRVCELIVTQGARTNLVSYITRATTMVINDKKC